MKSVCGLLLLALVASAQTRPEFEVSSVKPSSTAGDPSSKIGIHIDGAQVRCTYISLNDYIRLAYRVKNYQTRPAPP
jgi:uncharacterized protein (TIGR03435 family)